MLHKEGWEGVAMQSLGDLVYYFTVLYCVFIFLLHIIRISDSSSRELEFDL